MSSPAFAGPGRRNVDSDLIMVAHSKLFNSNRVVLRAYGFAKLRAGTSHAFLIPGSGELPTNFVAFVVGASH